MSLRILLVSDNYPPFIGGAHRQTQLLGRELRGRGHTVAVATGWQRGLAQQEDDAGVPVHRLKQLRTWLPGAGRAGQQCYQPPFPDPITTWSLRHLIGRFKPDVVHTYGWISYACAVALLGKDIPLLISARDYAPGCPTRELLYQNGICDGPALGKCLACAAERFGPLKGTTAALGVLLGRPLLRWKMRGLHSVSTFVEYTMERDFLGRRAFAQGGRTPAQTVIPSFREDEAAKRNGAVGVYPQVRPWLDRLPAEPFILFVGALRLVKGLEQLLAAYQRLAAPPPLVLIGTVEADTPRELPPGVRLLENFPHPAVMAAWDRCLFGVLPSLWPEPLGSVVYEGMSRGKAVIGTKPGGHADLIREGESGLLVPPGEVEALTNAMRLLIENDGLRERFGRAGRERAKLFVARVAVPRFEQMYHQLVAERAGCPWGNANLSMLARARAWQASDSAAKVAAHLRTPLYRNAYALTAAAATTSVLGLAYWALAARFYPAEAVGLGSAVLAALTLLTGLAQLGLNNALIRYVPVAGRATARLVGYTYLVCVITAGAASLAFGLGLDRWAPALKQVISSPFWLAAFVAASMAWCVFTLQDSVLTGLRRALWVPLENTAFSLAKIGLLIVLALTMPQHGIVASWTIPAVIALIPINLLIFRRLIPQHVRAAGAAPVRPGEIARFSAGNFLGALFFLAATNLVPLLVTNRAGPAANAYFYVPWMIATNLQLVAANMATSFTVEAALEPSQVRTQYYRALIHTTRLLVPVAIALFLAAPYILRIFGPAYAAEGTPLLRLLALALIPNLINSLALGLARAQNRVGTLILIQGGYCLLLLGLSQVWLGRYGLAGVGWAALAGQSLLAMVVLLSQFRSILRPGNANQTEKRTA